MEDQWFLLAVLLVGIFSGATAAVIGFGIGSLLTPLLTLRLGTDLAVAAVALPHLIATALRFIRHAGAVDRQAFASFGLWSAVGGMAGALLQGALAGRALLGVLGALLIATGVELKDLERARGWGDSFRRRTIVLKSRVFPLMTFALLLVIANFMLGAAAHTRALPAWVHEGLAWATLVTCLVTLHREYRVLGENNRLIEEAASRGEDSPEVEGRLDQAGANG